MGFLSGKTAIITGAGRVVLSDGRVCIQLVSPDFKYMTGEMTTLEGGLGQRP